MKSTRFALLLLAVAYAVSLVSQWRLKKVTAPDDYEVINLVHWQLEEGFRSGLDVVIKDFEEYAARTGRKVRVVQRAIPKQFYDPWLNTNLVGGSAPDIMEIENNWWRLSTLLQNFRQIDSMGREKNPFNDLARLREVMGDVDLHRNLSAAQRLGDPELAKPLVLRDYVDRLPASIKDFYARAAMKDTFKDGMVGGFNYELGAYYSVPISMSTYRLFYNRDLLRKAGYEEPPKVLHKFFEMCDKLKQLPTEDGRAVVPIAAYKGTTNELFIERWARPFTYATSANYDWQLTGGTPKEAVFGAWQVGSWDFDDPRTRAYFQSCRQWASNFQPGFMAMERDQASFAFVQQRAAMTIGSAENASFYLGKTNFEVGVMKFPLPGPGDPHGWDKIADVEIGELSDMNTRFGLSSKSAHPELAREFLQFLSSFIWNERFNRIVRKISAVKGASTSHALAPFRSLPEGVTETWIPAHESDYHYLDDLFLSQFWVYLSGQDADEATAYRSFVRHLEAEYSNPEHGVDRMWIEALDGQQRRARGVNGLLNVNVATQLLRGSATADESERYERFVMRDATMAGGELTRLYFYDLNRAHPREYPGVTEP